MKEPFYSSNYIDMNINMYSLDMNFNTQSTRRPQNLIPADVSKNVLSVHSTFRITVCWPSYSWSRLAV